MKLRNLVPALSAVLVFTGCDEFRYEITMRRTADGTVTREVQYSVHEDGHATPKMSAPTAQLQSIYGGDGEEARTHTFARVVSETLPADVAIGVVTNFGATAASTSPFGSVHSYRERAPGPTSPWKMVTAVEKMLDTTISAWLAYAASTPELRSQPDKLRTLELLLRGPLHDDAMDGILLLWSDYLAAARAQRQGRAETFGPEVSARIALFLQERGYLSDPAPPSADEQWLMPAALRTLLKRIHVELGGTPNDPLPPALSRLCDENDAVNEAFEQGLCAIGLTQEEFSRSLGEGFTTGMGGNSLTMKVRWVGQPQPDQTNGSWDAAANELSWSTRAVDAPLLPDVMFALWVVPNEKAQQQRFGSVLLRDRLADYNEWYRALSDETRATWDAFLAGLSGGPDIERQLRSWVAAHESAGPPIRAESDLRSGAQFLLEGFTKPAPN
jgi:hypothetical protein